jgi:hypothetical protein
MKLTKEMQRGAASAICQAEECGVIFALDCDNLVRIGEQRMPDHLEAIFRDYPEPFRWALIAVRQKVAVRLATIKNRERNERRYPNHVWPR